MLSAVIRRLPVLQNQDTDDAAAARRPRWHWILIGAGLLITLFLPLSLVGVWLGGVLSRAAQEDAGLRIVLGSAPVACSFLIASAGAGALVGRFGGRAKAREAAYSGLLGAFTTWALAALGGSLRPWLVAAVSLAVLLIAGGSAAFFGARRALGRRV